MVELPLALYVHWPWCVRKCPYCDFPSRVGNYAALESCYIDALLADLTHASRAETRPVRSVFFGGGTPSLMSEAGFARLMAGIRERVPLTSDVEVTLEANPGTVTREKLETFREAGVNRLSIGVQSFHDAELTRIGRIHNSEEAENAASFASEIFKEVNLDLMYALPGETLEVLREDVTKALSFPVTHLSFYELTIEEGSVFFKKPPEGLPDDDLASDMADVVGELTAAAGFEHYEVSAYAKAGHRCRHNLTYWTYGDYYGIGAGAHAKLTAAGKIHREERSADPARYMKDVKDGIFSLASRDVAVEDVPFEFMLNVLRLKEGVKEEHWIEATGLPLDVIAEKLKQLREEGLLEDNGRIVATALGRRFLNEVEERFLA